MAIAQGGRGRNSARLRRYNERLLLQVLRRSGGPQGRARRRTTTSTAIGSIIQSLEERAIVLPDAAPRASAGSQQR